MNTLFSKDPLFWTLVSAERGMVKDKRLTPTERHFALRMVGYGYLVAERNRRAEWQTNEHCADTITDRASVRLSGRIKRRKGEDA